MPSVMTLKTITLKQELTHDVPLPAEHGAAERERGETTGVTGVDEH